MSSQPSVEVVYDARANIGEGPHYDEETGELMWVDIYKKTVNFLNVSSGSNRYVELPDYVGAVFPCKNNKANIVALVGRSISLVNRETGKVIQVLASVEDDKPNNRFNDAKCDRKGRLWCGTMAIEDSHGGITPKQGALYCFDGEKVTRFVSEVSISNGIAWSLDWTKMYYIDSTPRKVYVFDYDEVAGTIANQQVVFDYNEHSLAGIPDGMCMDCEGKLWIACFGAGCVIRLDPVTGKKLGQVDIPSHQVTSCCFGGPDYSTLYVTSAFHNLPDTELEKYPMSGSVFAVTGLGVKGFLAQAYNCA